MNFKIWLIGGTGDSATIANVLAEANIPLIITVATESAKNLYQSTAVVIAVRMGLTQMRAFCQQEKISGVIDASHPYAVEVSQQAIAVAEQIKIPYLRYERDNYQPEFSSDSSDVVELDSFEHLLEGDYLTEQRVFLTVGCKALPWFKPWHNRATLFARVLPKIESLETALAAGFTSDRLVAIRPPISIETEAALWQQWRISLVVSKASGEAGGEDIKRRVAADLGIPLIIIARPQVAYPRQTSNMAAVLSFCQRSQNSIF